MDSGVKDEQAKELVVVLADAVKNPRAMTTEQEINRSLIAAVSPLLEHRHNHIPAQMHIFSSRILTGPYASHISCKHGNDELVRVLLIIKRKCQQFSTSFLQK